MHEEELRTGGVIHGEELRMNRSYSLINAISYSNS